MLGGARSGKSRYASDLASSLAGGRDVLYIATATAEDDEMEARIARHRRSRPAHWRTIEEAYDVAATLQCEIGESPVVLIDCLTMLITNHLMLDADEAPESFERRIESVVDDLMAASAASPAAVIIVSNEVGLGIVPEYPLGRLFRDVAGRANQRAAAASDRVVFMAAGIPMVIKGQ